MPRYTHDYELLERDFITSDLSVRQLCENHGIANWSTVHAQAKRRKWLEKRKQFKDKAFEHSIEALAEKRAIKQAELLDASIDVTLATLYKMAENLRSPDYIVTPQDLVKIIEKVQLLTGGVTSREEIRAFNFDTQLPPELLRELARAAREGGAGAKPVGQSALPIAAGPRKVN